MSSIDLLHCCVINGKVATIFIRGTGPYDWQLSIGGKSDEGSWDGNFVEAVEFARLRAEELSEQSPKHSGKIFAARDGGGARGRGKGLVLEVDGRGRLFDTKLRFESQSMAEDYVKKQNTLQESRA